MGKGKRPYKMSPAALAQRRGAAWKHGQDAATTLTSIVPPCKRGVCALKLRDGDGDAGFEGCETRRAVEAQGRALEVCPVQLVVNPDVRRNYLEALKSGNLEGLQETNATFLAGMAHLAEKELASVQSEGLAVDFPIFNKDGDQVGSGVKVNPRAEPLLKLTEQLGLTAAQQAITPKSAGEKKRDDGIGGALDFFSRRAALAAGPKPAGGDAP